MTDLLVLAALWVCLLGALTCWLIVLFHHDDELDTTGMADAFRHIADHN